MSVGIKDADPALQPRKSFRLMQSLHVGILIQECDESIKVLCLKIEFHGI